MEPSVLTNPVKYVAEFAVIGNLVPIVGLNPVGSVPTTSKAVAVLFTTEPCK